MLSSRARAKSVYERELMAIVLAVQKWRHYLVSVSGCTQTKSSEQRLVSMEHQKWLCKLLGYYFDIHYKPSLENKAVDALSRHPCGLDGYDLSACLGYCSLTSAGFVR